MSKQHSPGASPPDPTAAPLAMDPPWVDAVLPDIAGGEPNLLPVTALEAPLLVEVPMWRNSMPTPGTPERMWLFWNGDEVAEREFTAAVTPADRQISVPERHRAEGTHQLSYNVMTFNGVVASSDVLVLTVDRTAPTLAGNGGPLVFPAAVVTDGVTAEYLEENGDAVQATLPAYTTAKPGDQIRWYWDSRSGEERVAGSRTLTEQDLGKPITLGFTGDLIRSSGDGTRMARYQVHDRAGNASAYAGYVNLEVTANAPPRTFAWPDIKEAAGSSEQVTLDPLNATSGANVILHATADIRDDDSVAVQWAEANSAGGHRVEAPTTPDGREFRVPQEKVAFHIGKTLPVHYEVEDRRGHLYVSAQRRVQVLKINEGRLQVVQCEGVSGGMLSLASVPATGAKLTLAPWVLISADQAITIRVQGLNASNQEVTHTVIDQRRLTAAEVTEGIGKQGDVVIPRAFLAGLKLHSRFIVQVFVSFDQGASWPPLPNFPRLEPMLAP